MTIETTLHETLQGKVLHPESEEYDTANKSYFTVFESAIKPAYIAQPSSTQDVSNLISALGPLLKERSTYLAIRGTGHTPFAGSANIENGVTIDMRGLKGIYLSEDKTSVDVGVGETWGSVYDELAKHGLTTAGGRVGRVGVGGLVLGGGMSLYSTRLGFACDSVTDFEVVLASGEVVHANAEKNPKLWKSLRGGLNNFGVVTSIRMSTFESGPIWGGIAFYMPDQFHPLLERTVDFVNNEADEDTHIMSSTGYAFGHEVVTCCLYHTKGLENPPSLERFTSLPNQIQAYSSLRTGTHIGFCEELSKFTKDGVRSFYATLTIKPDVELMKAIHKEWLEVLEPIKDAEGITFSLGFFPLTKGLLQNSVAAGGNAMNIDPTDGPLFIVLINPTWGAASDDERVYAGSEKLLERSKQHARDRGLLHKYVFTNYAYYKEALFEGYDKLDQLKEVSQQFDPHGIFQHSVPGGFKLWQE